MLTIYRDFNKAFYFPLFSNGAFFSVVGVQYLTFEICFFRFPVSLSINEYSTHNNEQFGCGLIRSFKTKRIYKRKHTSTSQHVPICIRLGKCTYCPLIKNRSAIICNFTKKSHKPINLPKQVTCELSNVIYLITCTKCNKHYVGETSMALRKRMYEHKATVL